MFPEDGALIEARTKMVQEQLIARKIKDPRVLEVMRRVPRHLFVDQHSKDAAYHDGALPIGYRQTISQPYIVAYMTQALMLPADGQCNVLEIGTGSGYQAAILSQLVQTVYTVERIPPLADRARKIFDLLGINNIQIKVSDGGYGWADHAPYDGILTTAAAPDIPRPLLSQLKEGARLIAPVGPRDRQTLIEVCHQSNKFVRRNLMGVAFVPLIGEHGWTEKT